jgi:hypothetical protein
MGTDSVGCSDQGRDQRSVSRYTGDDVGVPDGMGPASEGGGCAVVTADREAGVAHLIGPLLEGESAPIVALVLALL